LRTRRKLQWLAIEDLVPAGLNAIEVHHSEHSAADVAYYQSVASARNLIATGGSDFHGENKPGIELGTGKNHNVCIDDSLLEQMRARGGAWTSANT
jgi:hypothetical protein